jgi:polysaccharide export outer membrane protein
VGLRRFRYRTLLCASILLSGCSALPADGPANMDVRAGQADVESLPYGLVKVTPEIIDLLATDTQRLSVAFADRRPPKKIRLGIGDVVRVTLFEAGAGGLFVPPEAGVRPGNFVELPSQTIDNNGNITVPYAPPIRASGRTPQEVQQSVVDALKNRAIEPQTVVTVLEQRTSLISVLGDVNLPARFPANAAGEHLLDVITRAGGPKSQGFDTWVMLERNGRRAAIPFGALVYEPSNNIYAHPNDTVYLYREPQTFVAFGASGRQGQMPFDAWRISLAEAVGKAGGLNDDKADPGSVFLYRGERRTTAELLGIDCSRFQGPIIPVVYLVNFRDPAGYFLATKFAMRNKDVIYVSNSFSVESSKALNYFRTIMATTNDPILAANNALIFKRMLSSGAATAIATTGGAISGGTP